MLIEHLETRTWEMQVPRCQRRAPASVPTTPQQQTHGGWFTHSFLNSTDTLYMFLNISWTCEDTKSAEYLIFCTDICLACIGGHLLTCLLTCVLTFSAGTSLDVQIDIFIQLIMNRGPQVCTYMERIQSLTHSLIHSLGVAYSQMPSILIGIDSMSEHIHWCIYTWFPMCSLKMATSAGTCLHHLPRCSKKELYVQFGL